MARLPTVAAPADDPSDRLFVGSIGKCFRVLETLGEKKEWRTGTLAPGESVLAEGRSIRFGILDPYAADNEGSVELELLSGDTESSGLVTPTTETGVKFVPSNK